MPEGHTIRRAALDQMRDLGGEALRVSSPQQKPEAVAAADALDGRVLRLIEAYGKHLFYRFAPAESLGETPPRRPRGGGPRADELTLHVHLGLFGKYMRQANPPLAPVGLKRLRMTGAAWTIDLSGPNDCELMDPLREDIVVSKLGPDPLRRGNGEDEFLSLLERRKISIAAALMDQAVVAGIGNVFRAEALHSERIYPYLPANKLGEERGRALYKRITAQLKDGLKDGIIITIDNPPKTAAARRRLPRREGKNVYKQEQCRTCGGPVSHEQLAGRTLWWCPHDQTS